MGRFGMGSGSDSGKIERCEIEVQRGVRYVAVEVDVRLFSLGDLRDFARRQVIYRGSCKCPIKKSSQTGFTT